MRRLVETLAIVPHEPVRTAALTKRCHRCDSDLRDILDDLVALGCVAREERLTKRGGKMVFWRKTRRI
ncbi:MAG: hypothetical protein LUQ44_00715 [Methanothrix sp.]|nr:hypothetical protein [Methanothrix sp.]